MLAKPDKDPDERITWRSCVPSQLTRFATGPGVSWDAGAAMRTRTDAPVQAGQRALGCGGAVRVKGESCVCLRVALGVQEGGVQGSRRKQWRRGCSLLGCR